MSARERSCDKELHRSGRVSLTLRALRERCRRQLEDLGRAGAFVYRNYHLTRRYWAWFLVAVFYAIVGSAAVVLIGVASGDQMQTLNLLLGVLMWSILSALFEEISQNIAYERWEGTIEYTFMAPVSTFSHLIGVSAFAAVQALIKMIVVLGALLCFVEIDLTGANMWGVLGVLVLASVSFMGLGLMAATLPLLSAENGAQATHILEGTLLLVSGVYYPVSVLPYWLQPLSLLSPATYALNACRALLGIGVPGSQIGALQGQPLSAVSYELLVLAALGLLSIPLGLFIFKSVEDWAKHTGRLKRSG